MPVKGSKSLKLTGIAEVKQAIGESAEAMSLALIRAVADAANDVATKSYHLVPVDTANLRNTQDIVFQKSLNQKQARAKITYGGPTQNSPDGANYALIQHERLDYAHPNGGQAKYLEQPFLEETSKWPGALAERVRMNYHLIAGGSL